MNQQKRGWGNQHFNSFTATPFSARFSLPGFGLGISAARTSIR